VPVHKALPFRFDDLALMTRKLIYLGDARLLDLGLVFNLRLVLELLISL
jgi:hypothetical protein